MSFIFEQYLPLAWTRGGEGEEGEEEEGWSPGLPLVAAVHLVRAMCVAGRHITSQLVSSGGVLNSRQLFTHQEYQSFQ